jgi:hypothetical protein
MGRYRVAREDVPEALIAYDQELALSLYDKHGFRIDAVYPGEWFGKPRVLSWQDVITARLEG